MEPSLTWYDEVIALTIQSNLAKLFGSLSVKVVPLAIIYPRMRHSHLHMTSAQVQVEVEVTRPQLQTKEVSRLKYSSAVKY